MKVRELAERGYINAGRASGCWIGNTGKRWDSAIEAEQNRRASGAGEGAASRTPGRAFW